MTSSEDTRKVENSAFETFLHMEECNWDSTF